MKFGVHFVTWGKYFSFDDMKSFFEQAKSTGAQAVEFRPPNEGLYRDKQKMKEIRKMAEDSNLEIVCCFGYPPGLDMCSSNEFSRFYAIEHLKRAVEATHYLGGKEIGGVLYSRWPADYAADIITPEIRKERIERSIESIRLVMPVAEDYDVNVNMEVLNRFENYIINTVSEGLDFIRQIDSKNCGLLLDTFHMGIEEDDIPASIISAKGHIGKFHVTEPNRGIPFQDKRVNWKEIGDALNEADFDGTVIIEAVVANDGLPTYNLRMWRNLIGDISLQGRLNAMRYGLSYIESQFQTKGDENHDRSII